MSHSLEKLLHQRVVLDTQGPMIYIGTLAAFDERGYWLLDADVHDRSDGHSPKEVYISQAQELEQSGARRSNRRRVFVERHAVISISALSDIAANDAPGEGADWMT
jgi:small nuclear ribonucleoprotein (snRNP)-like protein